MRQKIKQSARIVVGGRAHRSRSGMTARAVRGFSILEVMTAMFVVTVGLVTVIKIFSSGFINSATDRDRIVAAGLAQEGVEIVKNIRDNKLSIPGNFGFENFGPLTTGAHDNNQCGLDYTDVSFINSGNNQNCFNSNQNSEQKFSLNPGGNGFISSSATTKWARVVYVFYNDSSSPYSADVVSMVWWSGSNAPPTSVPNGQDQTKATIDANLGGCTVATKCVYATMHLDTWKP